MSLEWHRVLIYPNTRDNRLKVVSMGVRGYNWQCEKHAKIKCKGCSHFEKVTVEKILDVENEDRELEPIAGLTQVISLWANATPEQREAAINALVF